MFRIRRVYDDVTPGDRDAILRVQDILRSQFPGLTKREIAKLPDQLRNPLKYRFRSILFVAEDANDRINGFALLLHAPVLNFCFLDYISAAGEKTGAGIGGALYERVREEADDLDAIGIFFECLPDDPRLSRNPQIRKQNAARLRFYERYGAFPIINTAYETPVKEEGDNPPYLVFDGLGEEQPLPLERAKTIVRAILERKYRGFVPADYIEMVVDSFRDDPVKLRAPRYIKIQAARPVRKCIPEDKRIMLLVNDRHAIHHIEERGYVESPIRIDSILSELEQSELFHRISPRRFAESHIRAVHDHKYVDYFKKVCANLEAGESVYPYVFPIRNAARPPKVLPVRAGYYCIDTFTPLNRNAFLAARRAVDCALTAAERILAGYRLAYALVRPPGHHAERHDFGGFCYFNSAAIAADFLSKHGRVVMLDIDYHHGNGQQQIFYKRPDVVTISLHGHPNFAYPYFSGFADERGLGAGRGCNINYPLPEELEPKQYRTTLQKALRRLFRFHPRFLIVTLGLDTAREDPTGSWKLEAHDFDAIGAMIGSLRLPTLVVQEGGYDTRVLGINARSFFTGLWQGAFTQQEGTCTKGEKQ